MVSQSSEQGQPDAQNNLGLMNKNGLACRRTIKAVKWYR